MPSEGRVFGSFIECPEISKKTIVKEVYGFNLSLFNALHDDPTVQADINLYTHNLLSVPFTISEKIVFGEEYKKNEIRKVQFKRSGLLSGVCQWFELYFEGSVLSTAPSAPPTHWNQHIQVFENPIHVKEGDTLTFEVRQFSDRFSLRPIEISK